MAVKSAERVLRIFEHLSNFPHGLTAKQISEQLGYAGSSTFEILRTLSDNEYLLVDESKCYTLGPKLIRLGINAAAFLDINRIAAPILRWLMDTLSETVFMAVLSGDEVVYVSKINSDKTILTNASIGSRKPIYCTGLGKAFLSFMEPARSHDIIERLQFKPLTSTTVCSKQELYQQMEEFRGQGYAVDDGEIEEGLWCAAVPIYDVNNQVVAAVSVSGPRERMTQKRELVIKAILQASRDISRKCGCIRQES
ncbi:MAG: IclR family transcriptional regulator [Intestinimonas sp.]|jgi:DNA-binding IclR family transcriptional regulator|nr:IclR family transcriptional regulator [Intestinimonas sp.]